MKAREIIKKAQNECGETATGYKYDITTDSLKRICEMLWTRAANLCYTFCEWRIELTKVIGVRAFNYFLPDVMEFQQSKMNACKYYCFHGNRYCSE